MAGSVDQIQNIIPAVVGPVGEAHRLGLDGDPALALEFHLVEELIGLFTIGEGSRGFQQPVGKS
jgi:hypothetical protein